MNRKEFLRVCSGSCLGLIGVQLIPACKPTKHIQGSSHNNLLTLNKSEFLIKGKKEAYHKSIICKVDSLDFPLVIYRLADNSYSTLLLRCTHQGNELSMNGDILSCSAHGSEFNFKGDVLQGPAETPLQRFPTTSDQTYLYIDLTWKKLQFYHSSFWRYPFWKHNRTVRLWNAFRWILLKWN